MFGFKAKWKFHPKRVKNTAKKATFRNLGHAGAAIRLTARRSIKKGKRSSRAGQPPHTRKGQLKRSLRYAVDKDKGSVIIGPTYTMVGRSGMAHEFGGKFRGQRYPKRRFMGPALEKNTHKLSRLWADSIR
jgi:hypothetical protein